MTTTADLIAQLRETSSSLTARRQTHERAISAILADAGDRPSVAQQDQLRAAAAAIAPLDSELTLLEERMRQLGEDQARDQRAAGMRSQLSRGPEATSGAALARGQRFSEHPVVAEQVQQARAARGGGQEGGDLSLGRCVRGLVTGDWSGAPREQRAMSEGTLAAGGYTVPVDLSTSIIDRARNYGAVLPAGTTIVPMTTQKLNIARLLSDPAAAWHQENALITATDASFDQVTLTSKALAALTVVSRELLEDSQNIDALLEEAIAKQVALAIDTAALYGSGAGGSPLGVKGSAGVTTVVNGGGANGATLTSWDPIIDAAFTLADNNERANGVVLSPRTARSAAKFKDSTGQPLSTPPALVDLPRYVTNQVPNALTVGTSTNTSDVFVADWSQLYLGLRTDLQIQILSERYADYGQVGILVWWRGDVVVARPKAFYVLTGVLP